MLAQVEAILEEKPCFDSLYKLLKITTPKLKKSDLHKDTRNVAATAENKLSKLKKKLKSVIHPDKHPHESVRATKVFQEVDQYFNLCFQIIRKKQIVLENMKNRKPSMVFPREFHVRDKWHFLSLRQKSCKPSDVPAQVALQCINNRGAIAHGRKTGLKYYISNKEEKNPFKTVLEVFHSHGGSKCFAHVFDIKLELMTKGPLVSSSFILTEDFISKNPGFDNEIRTILGMEYPVLIVGWKFTNWVIQPLGRKSSLSVRFGCFKIEENCVAPTNTFQEYAWEPGPYFDLDFSRAPQWRTWIGMKKAITSNELEKLGEILGDMVMTNTTKLHKKLFVIRDRSKFAHSKTCYLKKVRRTKGSAKPWIIEVFFVDNYTYLPRIK